MDEVIAAAEKVYEDAKSNAEKGRRNGLAAASKTRSDSLNSVDAALASFGANNWAGRLNDPLNQTSDPWFDLAQDIASATSTHTGDSSSAEQAAALATDTAWESYSLGRNSQQNALNSTAATAAKDFTYSTTTALEGFASTTGQGKATKPGSGAFTYPGEPDDEGGEQGSSIWDLPGATDGWDMWGIPEIPESVREQRRARGAELRYELENIHRAQRPDPDIFEMVWYAGGVWGDHVTWWDGTEQAPVDWVDSALGYGTAGAQLVGAGAWLTLGGVLGVPAIAAYLAEASLAARATYFAKVTLPVWLANPSFREFAMDVADGLAEMNGPPTSANIATRPLKKLATEVGEAVVDAGRKPFIRDAAEISKETAELASKIAPKAGLKKIISQFGCFDGETKCLVTAPAKAHSVNRLTCEQTSTNLVLIDAKPESSVRIKDVELGSRVLTQNPNRGEVHFDVANQGFKGWKKISITVSHANGSVVDVEVLRSLDWIERNGLRVGKRFDFALTEIDIEGSGYVKGIEDFADVEPGEGSLVVGRFVTRSVSNRVEVTLENGATIVGTANHPVWCVESDDWIGLGEFLPGQHVVSRLGKIKVTAVENLKETAAVYNLEVAGEHVYEITELGILVHNAGWDCSEWLELRSKYLKGNLKEKDRARYEELLDHVVEKYDQFLSSADIAALKAANPDLTQGGHLHHILLKLGNEEKFAPRIIELQKILWHEHGIDPIMSSDIFVWAPMAGVHGDLPVTYVIEVLEEYLSQPRTTRGVLRKLQNLGEEAQKQFPGLYWKAE